MQKVDINDECARTHLLKTLKYRTNDIELNTKAVDEVINILKEIVASGAEITFAHVVGSATKGMRVGYGSGEVRTAPPKDVDVSVVWHKDSKFLQELENAQKTPIVSIISTGFKAYQSVVFPKPTDHQRRLTLHIFDPTIFVCGNKDQFWSGYKELISPWVTCFCRDYNNRTNQGIENKRQLKREIINWLSTPPEYADESLIWLNYYNPRIYWYLRVKKTRDEIITYTKNTIFPLLDECKLKF